MSEEPEATEAPPWARGILDTSTLILLPRLADAETLPSEPLITAVTLAELSVGPLVTDDQSERRRIGSAIERAVAQLGPEYRAAFLLREVHDMDYESIAEALRVDVGTVKSRLSRARAALRRALQGTYDER